MITRTLGGVEVSALGHGGMPMSVEGRPDRERSLRTLHAALDAGVTLIDTADAYHLGSEVVGHDEVGHNETLVAEALRTYPGDTTGVLVATKGGHVRTADGTWVLDGRPEHIRAAAKASATRLGVDVIDLYQYHRPDPAVPFAETIGAFAELLDEGVVRMVGVSNVDPDQIRTAHEILDGRLAAVQNQFSPAFRSSLPELRLCAELGVAFLPWRPLGGIGGDTGAGAFARVAREREVSPYQVCLAWELAQAPVVIPIPGASRPESVRDSMCAVDLVLTPTELAELDAQG